MGTLKQLFKDHGKLKKEDHIELEILIYLNKRGFFWKTDYAGKLRGNKYFKNTHPFVLSGMPDITGMIKGQAYFFEVKTEKEHQKILNNWDKYLFYQGTGKDQKRYKRQIERIIQLRKNGAIAQFVSSIEDVKKAIDI